MLRDFKIAYGMQMDCDFLGKIQNLKVFCVELNDLRGSDRATFPKLIADVTRALSHLKNLECVELSQKPGHTSCTFDDNDIEADLSVNWIRSMETILQRNARLQRINIFFPMLL